MIMVVMMVFVADGGDDAGDDAEDAGVGLRGEPQVQPGRLIRPLTLDMYMSRKREKN